MSSCARFMDCLVQVVRCVKIIGVLIVFLTKPYIYAQGDTAACGALFRTMKFSKNEATSLQDPLLIYTRITIGLYRNEREI